MSVEVWVAQDGEPHQAHVQSTFQAYMRELEFRIDDAVKEGTNCDNSDTYIDGSPLYEVCGCHPRCYITKNMLRSPMH